MKKPIRFRFHTDHRFRSFNKLAIFMLGTFLSNISSIHAQVPGIEWSKCFGGSDLESPTAILPTGEGGYIMTGSTTSNDGDVTNLHDTILFRHDIWLVKLNIDGDLQWQRTIGGSDDDYVSDIILTADGGYAMVGHTFSNDGDIAGNHDTTGFFSDICVIKVDSVGQVVWQQSLGGSYSDYARGISQTPDSGFVVVGSTASADGDISGGHGSTDIWLVKLNQYGDLVWQRCLGGTEPEQGYDVQVCLDGGFIVAGSTFSNDGDVSGNHDLTGTYSDYWLIRLTSDANLVWQRCLGGTRNDGATSVVVTGHDSYVVVGSSASSNGDITGHHGTNSYVDTWAVKLDSVGSTVWSRSLGGSYDDYPRSITMKGDSSFIIAAATTSNDGDVTPSSTGWWASQFDKWLVELDSNGTIVWNLSIGGTTPYSSQGSMSASATSDGGYVEIGESGGAVIGNHGSSDYWVVKLGRRESLTLFNRRSGHVPLLLTQSKPTSIQTFRFCADESSLSQIRYICDTCNVSRLKILVASDTASISPSLSGGILSQTDYSTSGDTLFATFTHPSFVPAMYTPFRRDTLIVVDTVSHTVLFRNPFEIYRAPVLFVHGLAANGSTFQAMEESLTTSMLYPPMTTGAIWSPLLYKADYRDHNLARYVVNQRVVPDGIDFLLDQAIGQRFSCGRVDIVGHSMGGLLPRLYVQSAWDNSPAYRNDVHKLITLNTPHYGTQAPNYWLDHPFVLSSMLGILGATGPNLLNVLSFLPQYGAIRDLRVNSKATRKLNIEQNEQPILARAVVATDEVGDNSAWAGAARLVMGDAMEDEDIYNGDYSDIVVPRESQTANLPQAIVVPQQWHIGASADSAVMSQVVTLLNANPVSEYFTLNGFPPNELEYFQPVEAGQHMSPNRSAATDSVTIALPLPGGTYAPNDPVSIEIEWSANINRLGLIVTGGNIQPISIDTVAISPLQFQVPANALGTLNIFLLGGDSSDWIANDETYITIASSAVPDSINCEPAVVTLPLGIIHHFDVIGYFPGNTPVNLNGTTELSIQFNAALLLDQGNGAFQGIAFGTDTLVFSYLGLSDTAVVTIVDDSTALVAAFDWTEDLLCQGNSVEFVDQSLGLATGFEWSFPGGTPSSSTGDNPVVAYTSPGVYDVSLITTFVNGTDTLVLDSLIEVMPLDTSVTLADGTLTANASDASYQWLDCATGDTIPGQTGEEFTPSANGLYAVVVTQGFCSDTSACYFVMTTGVDDLRGTTDASIVPNPNDGSFVLLLSEMESSVSIEITDMTGRLVFKERHQDAQRMALELDEPAGLYLLSIATHTNRRVLPLVTR